MTHYGGHVLKKLGDGLMAIFGYPRARENDAERAARAALAILAALEALNVRNEGSSLPVLAARVGLDSGPVIVDASGEVFGEAPNVAARVQSAAEPGTALVTAAVQRHIAGLFVAEDRGAHDLKGLRAPVALYRLVRASGGGRRAGARALTPFVGREEDLAALLHHWRRALSGEGQFVQIVGEPGIGKSRLIVEFRARLGETPHTWVEWASSELLQNTPLHPLAQWGRIRFGAAEVAAQKRLDELARVLTQLGLDPAENVALLAPLLDIPLGESRASQLVPEELRRRQLAAVAAWILAGARTQPLVLAFEDLHWADPTSLDLMKALTERGATAPLFIIATARPEFHTPWGTRSHHSVVALTPLDRAQIKSMVGAIAGRDTLSNEVVKGVTDRTGGVPLFVEEVTRLLLEGGAQSIPPTLQQSLAARLDRLGDAREVAQIGAVLGREFSFVLLRSVAAEASASLAAADRGGGLSDVTLEAALDRLAEADLLLVEGIAPEATYRFKHALIQNAAYESLLKSRRQAMHRRAAEALVAAPDPQPELVAHHFTQAGETEHAIDWWGKAGDAALSRSAFEEAIAHLGWAIKMADNQTTPRARTAPGAEATAAIRRQRDLDLRTSFARAVLVTRGPLGEETRLAYDRVREIGASHSSDSEFWSAGYAQWALEGFHADYALARRTAEMLSMEAETAGLPMQAAAAQIMTGLIAFYQGELAFARDCYARAIEGYRPEFDESARALLGQDFLASCETVLPLVEWHRGGFASAREFKNRAIARATASGHVPTIASARLFAMIYEAQRDDPEATRVAADAMLTLGHAHGMTFHVARGAAYRAWAIGRLSDPAAGAGELSRAVERFVAQKLRNCLSWFRGMIADLQWRSGAHDDALQSLEEGLSTARETGERLSEPFLYFLRGHVLLSRSPSDAAPAEEAFSRAIDIAIGQGAHAYRFRASLALAKLYRTTGRLVEAFAVLSDAVEGFPRASLLPSGRSSEEGNAASDEGEWALSLDPSPGCETEIAPVLEMKEIAEAEALLAALAETDAAKAAAAKNRRRLDLQTSYGRALLWARGFAAEETKAAFARVAEIPSAAQDPVARIAFYDAECLRAFMRGEYRVAREIAETLLREAGADAGGSGAAAARRMLGLIRLYQGDLEAAQSILESELAGSHSDPAGQARTAAFLALTEWHLGAFGRARRNMDQAIERANQEADAATIATALFFWTVLESRRDDVPATRLAADAFLGIAEKHGMRTYAEEGQVYARWAHGRLFGPDVGADGLEQALTAYMAKGNRADAPSHCGLLAELQAPARGYECALASIDRGLAIADETGETFTDPYLHRLRGELLLRRNPSDPAPAEEAFKAAIAVARTQHARGYELLASLSLAKLYRSTDRPADAHTALAAALNGFAPTPEMPETAEAQELMERLA